MRTGPYIGVGFEHKKLLLPVYALCPIYLDLTLNPNNPNKPYAVVIISFLPILIGSLFKYEYVPHQETMNLLW